MEVKGLIRFWPVVLLSYQGVIVSLTGRVWYKIREDGGRRGWGWGMAR